MRASILLPAVIPLLLVATDGSASYDVQGPANPNLAGRAFEYTCCGGDTVFVDGPDELSVAACSTLHFDVTGKVSYSGGAVSGDNPDGDQLFDMTNYGDGISAPLAIRANALVGVFLDDTSPTGEPTPDQISYSGGIGFASQSPGLRQIFFIGDGRTTDSSLGASEGPQQDFIAPAKATRLFLGTADGLQWSNNTGSLQVNLDILPEPRVNQCGDASGKSGITAADALQVLRAAVGNGICPDCVCDVDDSSTVAASDALRILRHAVGQVVDLNCPCCPHLD